jgi:alanine racemase
MVAGLGAAPVVAAATAQAAPILSARNFGLRPSEAPRKNAWLEIDADAFAHNINETRTIIGPGVKLCAVMKADAYGNGLDLLMPTILKTGVDVVAITSNDEARVAREMGYRGRLARIRTAGTDEMEDAFRYGVEELVANPEAARRLVKRAKRPLKVHLALNADGMSRNGLELSTDYGKADARALAAIPGLKFVGVMTHYPTEEADDINHQLSRFTSDIDWLKVNGLDLSAARRHTANTFATLHHPQTRLDMVRVGGALYGDTSADFLARFRVTNSLKSRVSAVNHYPAAQTVNYDRTYKLSRESWLANIPLGYSDGFRRSLSHANQPGFETEGRNKTEVLIGGQRFPIVGRVTMNTLMVDVTGFQDRINIGDEVVLYGKQGTEEIAQRELESNSSAYGPEVLAMLGNSLPKVLKR